jgi:glycosyltransferase involved in cell wall biosynthesis
MKFSIIVCAYNEEQYLEQCLESLYSQNYDKNDFEILIIDNESRDKTPEIGQSFFRKYKNELNIKYFRIKHVGLSTSRNFGVENADGNIVIFVDGDAITDMNLIEEYENTFEETNCDFSGGRINLLNAESKFANLLQVTRFYQEYSKKLKYNFMHGANMAFKKELLVEHNFNDDIYSRGDDTYLSNVLFRNNYKFSFSENSFVFHERPAKVKEYISVLRYEAMMSFSVKNLINNRLKLKKINYFKLLFKHTIYLVSAISILFSFFNVYFLGIFFVYLYKKSFMIHVAKQGNRTVGFFKKLTTMILIDIIYNTFAIVYFKTEIINKVQSKIFIIKKLHK